METKKCIGFLLAASLLAACSDDVENDTPAIGTEGSGYINVVINLPTQTGQGTRANSDDSKNDQFDKGIEDEYTVKNTTLVLFSGTDESNATFAKVIELSYLDWSAAQNGNVTSYASTGPRKVSLSSGQYWGLVILNKSHKITSSETEDLQIGDEAISNASDLTKLINSTSAADFCNSEKGFMMLNAPLASMSGEFGTISNQKVRTLVPVIVYESLEAANKGANNGESFFVERVVAKVTVGIDSRIKVEEAEDNKIKVDKDGAFSGDQVKLDGWFLNVTNNSTKFVRDVSNASAWAGYHCIVGGTTTNRFFSAAPLTTTSFPYRIYWGVDGNYDGSSYGDNEFTTYSGNEELPEGVLQSGIGSEYPCYCLENTFNTSNMNQAQTTGVVFKMTYLFDPERGDTETFFMLENDETIYLATNDGGDSDNDDSEGSGTQSLISKINEKLGDNSITDLSISTSDYDGGYYDTVDEIKTLFGLTGDSADSNAQKILTVVGPIKVYKNGACYYYTARIQHFGDYYTPLNNTDGSVPTYTEEAHLGRYGVLRNNWYEIEIAGVSGPGYPEIPEPGTDEPDDKKDYYINVKVNILAWAKRKQEVHL